MHLVTALLSLITLSTASAARQNTIERRVLFHEDLRPRQASSCPIAYPTPRSSPPDTQPPYPIQISLTASSNSNFESQGQGDGAGDGGNGGSEEGSNGGDDAGIGSGQTQPRDQPQRRTQDQRQTRRQEQSAVEIAFALPPNTPTPSNSGPCTLFLDLSSADARVVGAATVNVYALDGPDPGALVGTTRFAAGAMATVNSFACREEEMCFRLEVVDDDTSAADGGGDGGGTVGGGGQGEGVGAGSDGGNEKVDSGGGHGETAVEWLQGNVVGMGLGMRYGC